MQGIAANGRWTIAYIYLMEFWMTKTVVTYVPLVNCVAGIPPIIGTLLVSTITNGQTNPIIYTAIAANVIGLVGVALFVPESPKLLLVQGKEQESEDALKYVAKFNSIDKTTPFNPPKQEFQGTAKSVTQIICNNRQMLQNLPLIGYFFMCYSFGYYMIPVNLKYLGGNIFLNSYVNGSAEIIAKLSTVPVLACLGLKRLFFWTFAVAGASAMLLAVYAQNDQKFAIALMIMGTKAGLSMAGCGIYLSLLLLYPTACVATVSGLCNILSRMASIASPIVAELAEPTPMVILTVACTLAALLSLLLRI